jgi:hypothetical protein
MTDQATNPPADSPSWAAEVEALTARAAQELDAMVVVVALQPHTEDVAISVQGVPAEGQLAEMAQDVPRLLRSLAQACAGWSIQVNGPSSH